MCRRITASQADADDAAQEALIAIVRGLPRFDGRSTFATWAYRVAANASLDELRRRRRRPLLPLDPSGGLDVIDRRSADDLAAAEDRVAERPDLDRALEALPAEFRVPVVLRDVADLDYAEIAHQLGIPLGTVKSRIARGRAMLADHLSGNRRPTGRRRNGEP